MSTSFVLTRAAARDLDEIIEYVLEHSGVDMALHVHARLHEGFLVLAGQPGVGHIRSDLGDETLRVWRVFSYLIIYRPAAVLLEVIRIIHGARDLPAVLDVI